MHVKAASAMPRPLSQACRRSLVVTRLTPSRCASVIWRASAGWSTR